MKLTLKRLLRAVRKAVKQGPCGPECSVNVLADLMNHKKENTK